MEVAGASPPSIQRLQALATALQPSERIRIGLSVLGYLVTAGVIGLIAFATTGFAHDIQIWDRTGDLVRAGASPYGTAYDRNLLFLYAPPWAVSFAIISWLPVQIQIAGLFALELLAWRLCAGSWRRVGYLGLVPIFGFELAVGQITLLIAAAVALALRGDGRWAVVAAFAKLSPAFAIGEIRRPLLIAVPCVAVTLPVAGLWNDWFSQLMAYAGGGDDPVPYWARLAVAVGLLATRRRWARGLAVFVAIPNFTPNAYVLLAALMPDLSARATSRSPQLRSTGHLHPRR